MAQSASECSAQHTRLEPSTPIRVQDTTTAQIIRETTEQCWRKGVPTHSSSKYSIVPTAAAADKGTALLFGTHPRNPRTVSSRNVCHGEHQIRDPCAHVSQRDHACASRTIGCVCVRVCVRVAMGGMGEAVVRCVVHCSMRSGAERNRYSLVTSQVGQDSRQTLLQAPPPVVRRRSSPRVHIEITMGECAQRDGPIPCERHVNIP